MSPISLLVMAQVDAQMELWKRKKNILKNKKKYVYVVAKFGHQLNWKLGWSAVQWNATSVYQSRDDTDNFGERAKRRRRKSSKTSGLKRCSFLMKSWTVLIWSNDCDLFKTFKTKENIGPKHDRKCVAKRVISEKWYTRENFTPVCLFVPPKAQIGSTKAAVHKIMNILTPEKATCWCRKLLLIHFFWKFCCLDEKKTYKTERIRVNIPC